MGENGTSASCFAFFRASLTIFASVNRKNKRILPACWLSIRITSFIFLLEMEDYSFLGIVLWIHIFLTPNKDVPYLLV